MKRFIDRSGGAYVLAHRVLLISIFTFWSSSAFVSVSGCHKFCPIATILNFTKSVILAASPYGNICVRTKFDENTFTGDRDEVNKPNLRWRPPPSLILPKVWFWAPVTVVWWAPKLTQMCSLETGIGLRPKNNIPQSSWISNYTVSQKNTPDIFSCNLNEHFLISIIFGTNIT